MGISRLRPASALQIMANEAGLQDGTAGIETSLAIWSTLSWCLGIYTDDLALRNIQRRNFREENHMAQGSTLYENYSRIPLFSTMHFYPRIPTPCSSDPVIAQGFLCRLELGQMSPSPVAFSLGPPGTAERWWRVCLPVCRVSHSGGLCQGRPMGLETVPVLDLQAIWVLESRLLTGTSRLNEHNPVLTVTLQHIKMAPIKP